MRLHNLVKSEGATRPPKRVGRGRGSGHGKTSGRGQKGQKSRAGLSQRPGFESGHVPLYRKLPRRGFNNANFKQLFAIVNLGDLAKLSEEVSEVDRSVLEKAGIIRKDDLPLKVLGDGAVERVFHVKANKFSKSAREKIEKAGGKVVLVSDAAAASGTEASAGATDAQESVSTS